MALTLLITNHLFLIDIDSSFFGVGCVSFEKKSREKMDVMSYNLCNFTTSEK